MGISNKQIGKTADIKNTYTFTDYWVHKRSLVSLPLRQALLDTVVTPQSLARRWSASFPEEFRGNSQKQRRGILWKCGLTSGVRDVQWTTQAPPWTDLLPRSSLL